MVIGSDIEKFATLQMWSLMMHKKPASVQQTQKPHGCKFISNIIIQNTDGLPNLKLGLNKTLYLKVVGISSWKQDRDNLHGTAMYVSSV